MDNWILWVILIIIQMSIVATIDMYNKKYKWFGDNELMFAYIPILGPIIYLLAATIITPIVLMFLTPLAFQWLVRKIFKIEKEY